MILKRQNEFLDQFWLNVALCHDVISSKNKDSNELTYQGTSPDEITLLDTAKEVGYTFLERSSDTIKLNVLGRERTFKLLAKIDFTAERKKMSVVVRDEDTGFTILYTKGSDLAIFERLS